MLTDHALLDRYLGAALAERLKQQPALG